MKIKPFEEEKPDLNIEIELPNESNEIFQISDNEGERIFAVHSNGEVTYTVDKERKKCTTDKELSKRFGAAIIVMAQMAEDEIKERERQKTVAAQEKKKKSNIII